MADTKWSQFPSATPDSADEVVGLHAGGNARFSLANLVYAVRNGLGNIFQSKITANGILKGDGQGGVTAATAGTDYQAPLTAGTDYATPAQLDGKANQSQLAYVNTGTTATQNYSVGDYICWNGNLYTANQAISSGTTLSAGTGGNLTAVVGGGFNGILDSLGKLVSNGSAEMDNYTVFQVILTDPWVQGAARISCVYVKGTEVFMPYITYTGAQNQLYYAAYRINYNSQTRSIQIISALASNGSTAIPSISQIFGLV